jgi:hypothetical protein
VEEEEWVIGTAGSLLLPVPHCIAGYLGEWLLWHRLFLSTELFLTSGQLLTGHDKCDERARERPKVPRSVDLGTFG